MIPLQISKTEIEELVHNFPVCSVERLLRARDVLTWITDHEVELSKLRRIVEMKIIDYHFKDVKV